MSRRNPTVVDRRALKQVVLCAVSKTNLIFSDPRHYICNLAICKLVEPSILFIVGFKSVAIMLRFLFLPTAILAISSTATTTSDDSASATQTLNSLNGTDLTTSNNLADWLPPVPLPRQCMHPRLTDSIDGIMASNSTQNTLKPRQSVCRRLERWGPGPFSQLIAYDSFQIALPIRRLEAGKHHVLSFVTPTPIHFITIAKSDFISLHPTPPILETFTFLFASGAFALHPGISWSGDEEGMKGTVSFVPHETAIDVFLYVKWLSWNHPSGFPLRKGLRGRFELFAVGP